MNRLQSVGALLGFMWMFPLLAACGAPMSAPSATPSPPPAEAPAEWIYVALGDSEPICCRERSYPDYFADFVEQDLGLKVTLHNLAVSGLDSQALLSLLEQDNYRELISRAQVVTFVISMEDLSACPKGDTACAEDHLDVAMANYAAIIKEILALTREDTLIRAQTYDNPYVNRWKEQGVIEERPMIRRWNEQIVAVASRYDIPVADVYDDFNGPDGDEDPGDKGYIHVDEYHNNDAGARRMAELLRELGYEPHTR